MTIKLTTEQLTLIERAAGLGMTLDDISYLLGISPRTLDRKLSNNEEAREAYNIGRAKAKLEVTKKLFDLVKKGEASAVYFYLKCQCGWREKDKVEESNKTEVKIYLPQKESTN